MTKNYIFCRFFSFDDSKRHFYLIVKTNYLTAPEGRLVLVELVVASLSIRSLIILVFPSCIIELNIVVGMKCGHVVLYIENKTGLFIIDSIPHFPSGKRICQNKQNQEMWLHCLKE